MIGKKKRTVLECVLEEMQRRGLDTEGVRVVSCPGRGSGSWVVKDDRVIGDYDRLNKQLVMTDDVLKTANK